MTQITAQIEIVDRTEYDRVNHHIPTRNGEPVVERFVAITMRDGAAVYVTYTRIDTAFSAAVNIGDTLVISGLHKESRNDEYGPHEVLTRCKVGTFANSNIADRKAAKKAARLAKLFG